VGEEELKKGNVVLKDLRRHSQEDIPLADVANHLFNRVGVEPKT
jgi:histidyl-tRNA synthetase